MTVIPFARHKWAQCTQFDCLGCALCHGGLALCEVCGGGEGSLPTDCPGQGMHELLEEEVYAGRVDYRCGEGWVQAASRHSPAGAAGSTQLLGLAAIDSRRFFHGMTCLLRQMVELFEAVHRCPEPRSEGVQ